ncbi:hypothetical protein [Flavobacterium sp. RS13.1]|uniref:hypothetical protein n=1 Tax=Flavobacterium sp. RS13.1 TaxID=3400345 RepID=UPI003AAD3B3C
MPLREVIITNNNSNSNGSGNSGYENLSFSGGGSAYNGNSTNSFVTYGGGGGSNNGNNSSNTENCGKGYIKKLGKCVSVASLIEDRIKDSLDPCPKAVLEELKNCTTNDISAMLEKLGAGNTYEFNITSGYPQGGTPAQSIHNQSTPFKYTTIISKDYTDGTKLFKASLILHETVHVYFMSIIDDFKSKGYPETDYNINSFPSLFQAYCDKNYPPTNNQSANAHHKDMADKYVDAISKSLQEFQTGIAVGINEKADQIYLDLAWGGLYNTPIFDATYPSGTDRERILNRKIAEQIGANYNGQSVIGNPCK